MQRRLPIAVNCIDVHAVFWRQQQRQHAAVPPVGGPMQRRLPLASPGLLLRCRCSPLLEQLLHRSSVTHPCSPQ